MINSINNLCNTNTNSCYAKYFLKPQNILTICRQHWVAIGCTQLPWDEALAVLIKFNLNIRYYMCNFSIFYLIMWLINLFFQGMSKKCFFLCRNVKNWKIGILFNFQQHVNKVLNIGEFHLSVPRIKYDNNGKTYFIHRNWKYPGSINLLREGEKNQI